MKRFVVPGLLGAVFCLAIGASSSHAQAPGTTVTYVEYRVEAAVLDLTTDPMAVTAAPEYRVIVLTAGTTTDKAAAELLARQAITEGVRADAVWYPAHRVQRVVLYTTTSTVTYQ